MAYILPLSSQVWDKAILAMANQSQNTHQKIMMSKNALEKMYLAASDAEKAFMVANVAIYGVLPEEEPALWDQI